MNYMGCANFNNIGAMNVELARLRKRVEELKAEEKRRKAAARIKIQALQEIEVAARRFGKLVEPIIRGARCTCHYHPGRKCTGCIAGMMLDNILTTALEEKEE